MNLKNYIYFVPVIISLLGILAIILAVKIKIENVINISLSAV